MRHEFKFATAYLDKTQKEWATATSNDIHAACTVTLAATLRPIYLEAEKKFCSEFGSSRTLSELVVVDDNQDRSFLETIKLKFRSLRSAIDPGKPLVGKVKFRGSGPDELLQLADMICGATGAYLEGKEEWYRLIRDQDIGISPIP